MGFEARFVRTVLLYCIFSLVNSRLSWAHASIPEEDGDPLEPLCEPDTEISDNLFQCGSCEERCGSKSSPDSILSISPGDHCSCDKFCGFHGDCCQDFQQFCPDEFQHFRNVLELHPFTRNHMDFECRTFTIKPFAGRQQTADNLVITTCLDGSECEFTPELNEDVNTFVPMYDIHRGVHYISGQCTMCNGAREVIPGVSCWSVIISNYQKSTLTETYLHILEPPWTTVTPY